MSLAQLTVPLSRYKAKKKLEQLTQPNLLLLAAAFGDMDFLKTIAKILNPMFLEETDDKGNTPLMLAVKATSAKWIDRIDASGADPVVTFFIDHMVSCNKSLDATNQKGKTALMIAANGGDTVTVRKLIDVGADIEKKSAKGYTALAFAAYQLENHGTGMLQILLESGATVDTVDIEGLTPLMLAVMGSDLCYARAVEMLLNANADPHRVDADGDSVLSLSIGALPGNQIPGLLLQQGCNTAEVEDIPRSLLEVFETNFRRNQDKMLAFACGQHRRLGRKSSVQCLNREMVHAVWLCVEATSRVPKLREEDSDSSDSDSGN